MQTIKYFSHFQYASSFSEMHKFLPIKTSKKQLQSVLDKMIKSDSVIARSFKRRSNPSKVMLNCNGIASTASRNDVIYTLPEYTNFFNKKSIRTRISYKKINKIKTYLSILSRIPQIKFVGLSGTMAMNNAKKGDDIDLFVITAKNRLWYGRLVCMFAAELLRIRRDRLDKSVADKICLNLFFDEADLTIPKYKQTEYVAHEVLQTKPLINKYETYEGFIKANRWVKKFFPNRITGHPRGDRTVSPGVLLEGSWLFNLLENLLKRLQLNIIKQHQTNEIVTDTQLWFFPEDFEKKLIKAPKKPQHQY